MQTNPVNTPVSQRFHESSRQRSPRDNDALGRMWRKHEEMAKQIVALTQTCSTLQRQLDRLRLRRGAVVEEGNSIPCPYA